MKKKIVSGIIITILLAICFGMLYLLSPAASQARAESSLRVFLSQGQVKPQTAGCTSDSDGDGYGSCTVVDATGNQQLFQCTNSLMSMVPVFGSQSCKGQLNQVVKLR